MSSDDYYLDSEQLDSAFLAELDAIEAAHSNVIHHPPSGVNPSPLAPSYSCLSLDSGEPSTHFQFLRKHAITSDSQLLTKAVSIGPDPDESYDQFFDDIDPIELERLDKDVEEAHKHGATTSRITLALRPGVTRQLTLFGDVAPLALSKPPLAIQKQNFSKLPHSPGKRFGRKAQKVKRWDHTAFAKSGRIAGKGNKSKGKRKAKATNVDNGTEVTNDSNEEFDQFPAPIQDKYAFNPPPPFKHAPDRLAAQTWIYPTNKPKRDYQFNIVRDSLFENSLVSLPTGLGKTFIAGVVMLNYYRWFPDGKVVFVAPTKPLVAQQIEACHKTCGIPGGDAAELTGQTPRPARAKAWMEKRVFYMTPQTFMNDLRTDNCDPTDIVLVVIDEAHKATGDYAYAQVVRYLMAKNAHFRVLALTATPGAKPEAVQNIVDSLHISNIEIRDENSIDLRQYILPKKISTHVVKMTPGVIKVRDMLAKLMEKIAKRLIENGLLSGLNVVTLHSYRCSALIRQFGEDGTGKKFPWAYGLLKKLEVLARAMGYLLECSILMCYNEVHDLSNEVEQDGKKPVNVRSEPLFREIVKELERQHNAGFSLHPKLDKLQSLAVDYFVQAKADVDDAERNGLVSTENADIRGETKMMVFANYRSTVDEIVELLNKHEPMIRASRFIGQGADKHGRKGIAQKDQLEVIKKFKEGVYNVLVATSIGEEGLDIGEVDMIICYDAQKTPIRMLQRVGRTGRKRAGRVEVLLSEAREEANWDKAKHDYASVQASITRGDALELYADVDRLLPDDIRPKCLEIDMTMEEYVRDRKPVRAGDASKSKGTKRKRNADVTRDIPDGAVNGFIPCSKLISKRDPKKRKVVSREYDMDNVDDDDLEIQAGVQGPSVMKPGKRAKPKSKVGKKTATVRGRGKKTASSVCNELTLSQLEREIEDDTDDMEIELGIKISSPQPSPVDVGPSPMHFLPSPSASPVPITMHSSQEQVSVWSKGKVGLPLPSQLVQPSSFMAADHSWLLDSDSDDDDVKVLGDIVLHDDICQSSKLDGSGPTTPTAPSGFRRSPLSHVPSEKRSSQNSMLPPSRPAQTLTSFGPPPKSTFAIRHPGVRRKRAQILSSPPLDAWPVIGRGSSPTSPLLQPHVRKKKRRNQADPRMAMELLDLEAQVSGDETMYDSSDHDDAESESDRRFVEELPPTQASPSYNQTMAYRNSLFTQAPGAGEGPRFASKPVRRGAFGPTSRSPALLVSSSPAGDQTTDRYSMDSFVVEDDDDILLHDDSRSSGI